MSERTTELYLALRKTVLFAAGLLILLWFLFTIREVLLLFLFAASLAVALNNPVTWLTRRGLGRFPALALVLLVLFAVLALFGYFVIPRVLEDVATLVQNLPGYIDTLRDEFLAWLQQYPGLASNLGLSTDAPDAGLPSATIVLEPAGRYFLDLLGWLAVIILLFSVIIYMVAYPESLLEAYQRLLPPRLREPGLRAFVRASEMIVGWVRANVIAGLLEAAAAALFLSFIGVPSALVWAALTFFAELVPRLGLYLMALPPIIVALAVDPVKALWVALFYIVMDQLMGDFILPRLQKETMNLHPVLVLFAIFALAAAFGIAGALLAVPLAAVVKAFYQVFYVERQPEDPGLEQRTEQMLHMEIAISAEEG
ncbi:MAG: AI-2E family transporter [Candidatus Promineifilaceae bacterium]|nr:AI-2E family transporter [Candidatus Promineifilaceae bacterium]